MRSCDPPALRLCSLRPEVFFHHQTHQTVNMPFLRYVSFDQHIMDLKMELIRKYVCQGARRNAERKLCEARFLVEGGRSTSLCRGIRFLSDAGRPESLFLMRFYAQRSRNCCLITLLRNNSWRRKTMPLSVAGIRKVKVAQCWDDGVVNDERLTQLFRMYKQRQHLLEPGLMLSDASVCWNVFGQKAPAILLRIQNRKTRFK